MVSQKFPIRFWLLVLVLLVSVIAPTGAVQASVRQTADLQASSTDPVEVVFFWGDGCPHCAEAKPYLDELAQKYSNVSLRSFEIYNSQPNQELFKAVAAAHGFEPRAVPTILIGERYWEGYNEVLEPEIEAALVACINSGCPAAGKGLLPASGEDAAAGSTSQPSVLPVLIGLTAAAGAAALIYFLVIKPGQQPKKRAVTRRRSRAR